MKRKAKVGGGSRNEREVTSKLGHLSWDENVG